MAQGRERYDVRVHIALTRATLGCVVVATAEEIAADARLSVLDAARARMKTRTIILQSMSASATVGAVTARAIH